MTRPMPGTAHHTAAAPCSHRALADILILARTAAGRRVFSRTVFIIYRFDDCVATRRMPLPTVAWQRLSEPTASWTSRSTLPLINSYCLYRTTAAGSRRYFAQPSVISAEHGDLPPHPVRTLPTLFFARFHRETVAIAADVFMRDAGKVACYKHTDALL